MSLFWRETLRFTLYSMPVAGLAGAVGWLVGPNPGWAILCLWLIGHLGHHLAHFSRLSRWTSQPGPDRTLEGNGVWDQVFAQIYRHEKELAQEIARRDADIARFEAVGQALRDGIVLLDSLHQIDWCNGMAESQLGLHLRTDLGLPVTNLVRQPEFVDYLTGGDYSQPLILRGERKEERVLSLYVLPYAGNMRLMQIKDVTQTDRLDRMRRDFVANVSHELRTPLTVLAGFLETLRELPLSPEEQARYLQMMSEQSARMQATVQDLLTLSSLEAAPPPEDDTVDMHRLLDKLLRDGKALSAGRHDVLLQIEGDGDLRGAEPELASAFGNLVANAIRYTPEGGRVTLCWKVSAEHAEFAVQDSGIGIAPEHIPRLTERFYRVDRGRSRDSGGTGLGLAIVKHSLNRHDGRLQITSELGKGSRFAAIFPPRRLISR